MGSRLRHLDKGDKMCHQISLSILEEIYPKEEICAQLSQHQAWEQRERRMSMLSLIYLLLAAALWTRLALPRVLERLLRPLHLLGLPLSAMQVSASAISYRRQQLDSAPLEGLLTSCCRPLCTQETIGAYRFGRRVMALDGSILDVADTPANAAAFARPSNQYGEGPSPKFACCS